MIFVQRFNPPDNYKNIKPSVDGEIYTGAAHFAVPTTSGVYYVASANLPETLGFGDIFAVVVFVQQGANKAAAYVPLKPDTGKPYRDARASFTTFGNRLYLTVIDKTDPTKPITDVILMENAQPL